MDKTRRHMTPLMKTWEVFQAHARKWRLSREETITILGINEEVYDSWVESEAMSLERGVSVRCIECFMLHDVLCHHLPEEQVCVWLRTSNTAQIFQGRTPIQTICEEIQKNPGIIREILEGLRTKIVH